MDTGGAGDSSSQTGRGESEEWTGSSRKHCRSPSKRRDARPAIPFPLQDHQGWCEAILQLYHHAGEQGLASQQVAALELKACHPKMELEDLTSLNNQVLLMIAEYHLTSTSQGTHPITPILPTLAAQLVPPISEYLPGEFQGPHDMRVMDQANTLHVATWLHCLDLTANYGRAVSVSLDAEQYDMGPLLEYFLMLRTSRLTFKEVT